MQLIVQSTTFEQVRNSLVALLNDVEYKVITLKGKWGTGKTFLWVSVRKELFDGKDKEKQPIYVSLFGAKTINELKLRILQNAYLKDASNVKKIVGTVSSGVKALLNKFTGISAEDSMLIWLPNITDAKLIVIDDIERKHKSLDIEELLGFLDEYSETHNTRFLILLNTDKLLEPEMWATLHEKVVDAELVLNPSPSEAFEIVAIKEGFSYLAEVKAALAILNVNNIRVIERVLKLVKQISSIVSAEGVPSSRWIPSTVLLAASHYHAVENPPPNSYILSFNTFEHYAKKDEEASKEELAWSSTLNKLGINYPDEYEETLVDYLSTGLLDTQSLKSLFIKYKIETEKDILREKISGFFEAIYWHPNKSKTELVAMANGLFEEVKSFNPADITAVISELEKLEEVELAKDFLNSWIDSVENRPEYQSMGEAGYDDYQQKIHPEIIAKLNEIREEKHPRLSVTEAIQRIVKNSGWGDRERLALHHSTVADYETALKSNSGADLRRFVKEHLGWLKHGSHDEKFKNGLDNFIKASINICTNEPKSRIAEILYENFKYYGLIDKLTLTEQTKNVRRGSPRRADNATLIRPTPKPQD